MQINCGVQDDGTQPAAQRSPTGIGPEFRLPHAIDDLGAEHLISDVHRLPPLHRAESAEGNQRSLGSLQDQFRRKFAEQATDPGRKLSLQLRYKLRKLRRQRRILPDATVRVGAMGALLVEWRYLPVEAEDNFQPAGLGRHNTCFPVLLVAGTRQLRNQFRFYFEQFRPTRSRRCTRPRRLSAVRN